MKRLLLAGAAVAALTSSSFAADPAYAPEPVDVWSGFFVGIQAGYAWKDVDATLSNGVMTEEGTWDSDEFVGGLYYGRNWQFDSFVVGLDSSISYMGLDEDDQGVAYEANLLGLSRMKAGLAFDNTLLFVAGGLATTWVEVETTTDDDDSFAFGWTVGAGVEHKFTENWSARIEYAYFKIEEDGLDVDYLGDPIEVDVDIDGHIVRAGVAYHF